MKKIHLHLNCTWINKLVKRLYIPVCVYFSCQSHGTELVKRKLDEKIASGDCTFPFKSTKSYKYNFKFITVFYHKYDRFHNFPK